MKYICGKRNISNEISKFLLKALGKDKQIGPKSAEAMS